MADVAPPTVRTDHAEVDFGALASAVVEQATTFVGICDAELRPCFVNAFGRAMIGLGADADISDYAILDFFTLEHRPIVERVGLPTVLREGRWESELCFCHFTDPSRHTEVRWTAFALHDRNGHFIGAATFTTDISARKQAERELRDQQMLLHSLLENIPLGVGVYGHDASLFHSNQRMRDYVGLAQLPSSEPLYARRWRGYSSDGQPIPPDQYPGARALRGETVMPGIDFIYRGGDAEERWMRVSAVPFRREDDGADQAIVVVQDVHDLKRIAERAKAASAALASQSRFLRATLSSIPDYVYAFDRQRRFAYANPAMLGLFGLSLDEMVGKTFADLDYPAKLAEHLNEHMDRVLRDSTTVEDEVFFRSPTGHAAYFSYVWGPVHSEDGAVELVVGVSRDTTERRAFEEKLRRSEARLRAATELAGLAIYSWNPVTGALEWDDRLRAMWDLPAGAPVDVQAFEAGIHPDDLPRVNAAVARCIDPAGDGAYDIEYRVIGQGDGITRHIATSGRTSFADGCAVGFIGAALDVSAQRRNEAAVRASEAQFRGFAEHSSSLIWIVDPAADAILYRSAAYERIWGVPIAEAPAAIADWMNGVHPDDRVRVEHALHAVKTGEVMQYEYRIVRPHDGTIRWLRDTSFPIRDENGAVIRIGGIAEDLTQEDVRQVYIVCTTAGEARRLASLVRATGYRARTFDSAAAFLDLASVLAPGCVLVDIRTARDNGLAVPRELKARGLSLPVIALEAPGVDVTGAVVAMKAGIIDCILMKDDTSFREQLAKVIAECQGAVRPATRDENAGARVARLTRREREVLVGLIEGGTNKSIAQKLKISPRTVELHRAQVMSRLDAGSLTELLQTALSAGLAPSAAGGRGRRRTT